MSVTLREVDRHNLDALLGLKVSPEQEKHVATNAESMAQAAVMPELTPRIAYDGDTPVGFVMWTLHDEDDDECWFYRLLVDESHQRRGYGRVIMTEALAEIRALKPAKGRIYIGVVKGNDAARALYESLGFIPDGRVLGGETIYCLTLS